MSAIAPPLPMPLGYNVASETDVPNSTKPNAGAKTPRQDLSQIFNQMPFGNGNNSANPCGFWGYGRAYRGTYPVYRFMLEHPRIRHARAQVLGAFCSAPWSWEVKTGTPEPQLDFVRDMLTDVRARMMPEVGRSLDYGHYAFEKIWNAREGAWWIDELKPLAVDNSLIRIHPGGKFAGIQWGSTEQYIDNLHSFLFTYDGEAGELYGRARLENIRSTAWRDWLDAATQLEWTCRKISGKLAVITTPAGSFEADDGTVINWRDNAMAAGKAIADPRSNGTVWMPTQAVPGFRNKEDVDFAKLSLVQIDIKDFGDHAAAITGFLARMAYDEEQMFAGYLRSPRTGMESKTGSRADAQEHTDTDTADIELLSGWVADAFNLQVVNDALVMRYGEKARNNVRAVAGKLRDESRDTDYKIVDGILANPELSTNYLMQVDADAVTERRGIPKTKTIVLEPALDTAGDEVPPNEPGGGGGNQPNQPNS